jgi:hypothetical protein
MGQAIAERLTANVDEAKLTQLPDELEVISDAEAARDSMPRGEPLDGSDGRYNQSAHIAGGSVYAGENGSRMPTDSGVGCWGVPRACGSLSLKPWSRLGQHPQHQQLVCFCS